MNSLVNRAIVTGGTKSDVAAIAVLAMNIKKTNGHLFSKMIVFHDGIGKKDQNLIKSIIDTDFYYYQLPFSSQNSTVLNYFSIMLYCKYECFRLLEKYDEVVWTDYDVLFVDKIDDFCLHNQSSFNIVVDTDKTIKDMFHSNINNEEILEYDLGKEALCTPLFSISKKIGNYMDMYKWCYKKTQEYEKDLELAEQCIISLLVQEYNIKYKSFENYIYSCHPKDMVGREKILHTYGQPKFWNGVYNAEWDSMYCEWIRMGGTKYSDLKKKLRLYATLCRNKIKKYWNFNKRDRF